MRPLLCTLTALANRWCLCHLCRAFGWLPKNEISNGRWAMFGFGVGLLTEYATGVDFVNQFKLMLSYSGIVDLE